MTELLLAGCTPEPLMGYLKALGVFRLVAEQTDPAVRMSWGAGGCRLHTCLARDGLSDFFLNRYRPTPILAPWNGGSGFYGGGSAPLDAIRKSSVERLSHYRAAINSVQKLVPKVKPKDEAKQALLIRCRADLPDELVPWLDACFALGEDGASYFPLLGTGGNDGRLDFTNNFFQRLADVIPFKAVAGPSSESAGWLASALFADDPEFTALGKAAVGQFNPGGIGGANGVQGDFEAGSRVNPWDFVLMIEGALMFAGSVARRLGAHATARAVFPFTVESVAVGYGSAAGSEESADGSRAELWLPLWPEPAELSEVRQLFAEGRAQVGRRQARNAVEFAVAACLLGVGRGIQEFSRFGFLKRNGLAFLAAPLGRVPVVARPEARLLNDRPLTDWIERLRMACRDKDKSPARYQTALRNINRAMYEFASRFQTDRTADRRALLEVLRRVGRAERTLAGGLTFCEDKYLRPLQGLSLKWLSQADDKSPEFGLAASLAGIGAVKDTAIGPFRIHLEPVALNRAGRFEWDKGSTSAVWSNRSLEDNLAAVFSRRQMDCYRARQAGVSLDSSRCARLADVIAFLDSTTDEEKLQDLIWGLSLVEHQPTPTDPEPFEGLTVPFEYGVPRLLVESRGFTASRNRWLLDRSEQTIPDPAVFHVLSSARMDAVESSVDLAAKRLKSRGRFVVGYCNRRQSGKPLGVNSPVRPARLLAACLFPLSRSDLEIIANTVLYPPETKE